MRAHGLGIIVLVLAFATAARAATVPAGYVDQPFVAGLNSPTAMQFAPDGRLFVCEQGGALRVIEDGVLLQTPFVTLTVDSSGERGLLGIAFDPQFEQNHYLYVYYTATSPTLHNRVSRFTANGNVAVPGSEIVIFEIGTLGTAVNHNGGAIHFGNDGRLYVAVGDNRYPPNAKSLTNLFGKLLRIRSDGTIPTDNPFYTETTDSNRAIWARGLRNPFTVAIQEPTGRIFINDVGQNTSEEVNEGAPGANYGWPTAEGTSTDPRFTNPVYSYGHTGGACAITGGAFYDVASDGFPAEHVGDYFFADFCAGWIRKLDTMTLEASNFAAGIVSPVDLKVGADGALYYLTRGTAGAVGRIVFTGSGEPAISQHPVSRTVSVGQNATFAVVASGAQPLTYQWRRNLAPIAGATGKSHTVVSAQLDDDGSKFDVVVSNDEGSATSNPALLTVTANTRPTASITKPVSGALYAGGDIIEYAATASDVEDGTLPGSALTWWINLHHDSHSHPVVLPYSGVKTGTFTIPTVGETSHNVFYRIHLKVTDSGGLTRTLARDVKPRKVNVTLATEPAGLQLLLDGQPVLAPHAFIGVVGIERTIEAVSPQTIGGATLAWQNWSDGRARSHPFLTPASDTTYLATFGAPHLLAINDVAVIEGQTATRSATFTVSMSAPSASSVTVPWSTRDGTAKAATDYVAASGIVTFAPGGTSRTLTVTVNGDTTAEPDETFHVRLGTPVGATLGDTQGTATIRTDDALGTLRLGSGSYRKSESSGSVTVTVLRSNNTSGTATVNYSTTSGSAHAGTDFTSTSGTLTLGDGIVSKTLTIPLANDYVIEPDETFSVTLASPSAGYVLGTPSSATITVQSDDRPGVISYSTSAYTKSEAGPAATITVSRSGGFASGVTVDYATMNGTATAGLDYSSRTGSLLFAGGVTSLTFQVPITNDTAFEGSETVKLSLSNPTGGATLGTRPVAVLTITDNDKPGTLSFSSAAYSRSEDGGFATITVKRSGGAASGVSVSYATGGGTAAAGNDYAARSGTLDFAAGQTSAQFTIPLTDDQAAEGNETVGLALSSPQGGATLGTQRTATLTILDDD